MGGRCGSGGESGWLCAAAEVVHIIGGGEAVEVEEVEVVEEVGEEEVAMLLHTMRGFGRRWARRRRVGRRCGGGVQKWSAV